MPRRLIILILMHVIIFSLMGYFRYIDVDEGFYLTASKVVTEGKLPYIGFLYPQAPLMPYFLSGWMKIFGCSWVSARVLSVISSVLINLILTNFIYRKTKSETLAAISALLFIFNGQLISWLVTAKTYSLTMLFTIISFVMLTSLTRKNILIAGFFLGLATNVRLLLLPLVFVSIIWIFVWRYKQGFTDAIKHIFIFIIGFIPTCSLSLYLFFKNPYNFLFNNVGLHLLYSELNLLTVLKIKFKALFRLLSMPQFFMLFIASIGTAIILRKAILRGDNIKRYKDEILSFLFFSTITASSLAPLDTHLQYFVMIIPFLIIFSSLFISEIQRYKKDIIYSLSVILIIVYILISGPSTGLMGGINDISKEKWKWDYAEKISKKAKEFTEPADLVLSWWSGYTFLAGRRPFPGMENEFGYFLISDKIPYKLAKRYRIATEKDLRIAIMNKVPKVIIWDSLYLGDYRRARIEAVIRDNYIPIEYVDDAVIYISEKKTGPHK